MSDKTLATVLIILAVAIGLTLIFVVKRNQRLHSIIHELENTLYRMSVGLDKEKKGSDK